MRNWAGNITFSTDVLHEPDTVEQLQEIVARSPRVRALGSGHSFSPVADTPGELVSVRRIATEPEIDAAAGTVTVGAGQRYGEIAPALDAAGVALHNMGSLPHIAVGGACATGTHGSGDGNGNLATAVEAVEFVRPDGELQRLSRKDDPDVFGGAVLSLGALGITTRLTLAVQPRFDVRQDVHLDVPFEQAAERADEIFAAAYSVSMFSELTRPDVVDKIWVKRRVTDDLAPADGSWLGGRLATTPQHPLTGGDPAAATAIGVPGPWHERLPHFRLEFTPSNGEELQTEFFVPRAAAGEVLRLLRTIAPRIAGPLQVIELRTVAADDLWLSPARERASLGVHFTWHLDMPAVQEALAVVEPALAPLNPRVHWGKVFRERDDVESMYAGLPQFRALAAQYDPQRKLGNAFLDRYVYG